MRDFNQGNRSDRRGSFGGRSSGGRDFGRRQMHDAVCDECGKNCKVPFRPSGDKPIYCSSCFENKGGKSGGSYRRPDRGRPDRRRSDVGNNNEQFNAINAKLDKILEMLTPTVVKKKTPKKSTPEKKKPAPEKKAPKKKKKI